MSGPYRNSNPPTQETVDNKTIAAYLSVVLLLIILPYTSAVMYNLGLEEGRDWMCERSLGAEYRFNEEVGMCEKLVSVRAPLRQYTGE